MAGAVADVAGGCLAAGEGGGDERPDLGWGRTGTARRVSEPGQLDQELV